MFLNSTINQKAAVAFSFSFAHFHKFSQFSNTNYCGQPRAAGVQGQRAATPKPRRMPRVDELRRTCSHTHTLAHTLAHTRTAIGCTSTCNNFMCPSKRQKENERKKLLRRTRCSRLIVVLVIYDPLRQAAIAHVFFTLSHPLPPLPGATASLSRCYVCQVGRRRPRRMLAWNWTEQRCLRWLRLWPVETQMLIIAWQHPWCPLCLIIIRHNSFGIVFAVEFMTLLLSFAICAG